MDYQYTLCPAHLIASNVCFRQLEMPRQRATTTAAGLASIYRSASVTTTLSSVPACGHTSLKNHGNLCTILFTSVIRPPDIHVGRLIFYWDSFFLFFATYPLSSLNGTQAKSATWSKVSAIWKCMSEIWNTPPTNRAPKNIDNRARA